MRQTYKEALVAIVKLQAKLDAGDGNRLVNIKELMRHKRNLSKYPEHKALKKANDEE